MCGIAGLLDPDGSVDRSGLGEQVAGMTATIAHRGPDAAGVWCDPGGGVALGSVRLAVVGLGKNGDQPMASADGRWVISYNGEVYNHRELRRRLESGGAVFRGTSDTEVLVEAVARLGVGPALDAAEGMFALALWDRASRALHLVRDRFGEKPLYYGWVGRRLAWGSELKALMHLRPFDAEIDRDAVALFLRHNCVPAPWTIYRGIAKLCPGQHLVVGPDVRPGSMPAPTAYWSAREAIEKARAHPHAGSTEDMIDDLEATLSDSVAARMVADVPVGAFLSGGIDSSVVVSLMQRASRHPVRTFTIGYSDRSFDESTDAAAVAAHLGTDHTSLLLGDDEAAEVIPQLPEIWDEPFGDVSEIPMHLVSKLARTEVTVALSGDGGDELFAGYNRHAWLDRIWRRAGRLPAGARRAAGRSLHALPPGAVDRGAALAARLSPRLEVRNPSYKVAKVGKVLGASGPEDAYLALTSYWDDAEDMVVGAGRSVSVAARPEGWPELSGITEQMLWLDLVGYLPDDILTKLDRAAMAVSLETRVPFLDRAVLDLAWRLPLAVKLHEGSTKWILRKVLDRYVPPALVERPKMGFGFPVGPMLRGTLRPWAEELLGAKRLSEQGLLDPAPIRQAWSDHLAGRRDLAHELWDVLALQAWLDRWRPST